MNNKKFNSILKAMEAEITPLLDKDAGNEFHNFILELQHENNDIIIALDQEKGKNRQSEKTILSLKLANATLAGMIKNAVEGLEA